MKTTILNEKIWKEKQLVITFETEKEWDNFKNLMCRILTVPNLIIRDNKLADYNTLVNIMSRIHSAISL